MATPAPTASTAPSPLATAEQCVQAAAGHRDATSENFPVASFLLPRRIRGHVLAFYRFARAADDIADAVALSPAEKIAGLDRLLAVIDGAAPHTSAETAAAGHRASLRETGVSDRHARDLLAAFRRDAENPRCADWADLMAYCRLSAASVGRFLIELNGDDDTAYPASDALCAALQVLNHLQDLKEDLLELDRIYLPLDWLAAEGATVADLRADSLNPAMRRVIDRCLDETDRLLTNAATLPCRLSRSRLRYEAAVILTNAERLSHRLRRDDPLAGRVALGNLARMGCVVRGIFRAWRCP